MIRYDLVCDAEHAFDGWFRDSAAFDEQAAAARVVCPHCGSDRIAKAPMAPSIARRRGGVAEAAPPEVAADASPAPAAREAGPGDGPAPTGTVALARTPEMRRLRELARRLREHVVANADYVGDRFAEEARKIHHEEVEARGIYGEATVEETRALREEGIDFHPLPRLPDDQN